MHNELTERLRDGRSKQPSQHHTNLCMVWYCGTSKRFVNEYGNKIKSYLFAHARSVRNAILPDGDGFIFIIILYTIYICNHFVCERAARTAGGPICQCGMFYLIHAHGISYLYYYYCFVVGADQLWSRLHTPHTHTNRHIWRVMN